MLAHKSITYSHKVAASDHTDPNQHGVSPAADAHRDRQLSAAAAAAIAGIDFARWNDVVGEITPHLEDAAAQTVTDTLAAVHAELTDQQAEAVKAEARKSARDRAAELVGRSHVGGRTIPDTTAENDITDSTARMIAENVRQAIVDKSTVEELASVLSTPMPSHRSGLSPSPITRPRARCTTRPCGPSRRATASRVRIGEPLATSEWSLRAY